MAIKRELSDSGPESEPEPELDSGSDFEPEHEIDIDIKPSTPKKSKTQPKKAPPQTPGSSQNKRSASSPISGSGSSTESQHSAKKGKGGRVDNEAKRMIAESIIKIGSAGIDVNQLSQATGLTCQQVRSQVVDNRSNLRKQLMDLARGL